MSRKSFNPHECISLLNTAKQAMQMTDRPFNKETILKSLKGCNLPTNSKFWKIFSESGILQKVSRGHYMFSNKNPIYVGVLAQIQRDYLELLRHYRSNIAQRVEVVKLDPEETPEESPKEDFMITTQSAIDILKKQGYLVFAPSYIVYTQV